MNGKHAQNSRLKAMSGMADPLDTFSQTPCRQITLNAQIAGYDQVVFGFRVFKLTRVPKRSAAELFEGAAVEGCEILGLFGFSAHNITMIARAVHFVQNGAVKAAQTRVFPMSGFHNMGQWHILSSFGIEKGASHASDSQTEFKTRSMRLPCGGAGNHRVCQKSMIH